MQSATLFLLAATLVASSAAAACTRVRYDLRTFNDTQATEMTVQGDCVGAPSLVVESLVADSAGGVVTCRGELGCGVESSEATRRKRQNDPKYELSGSEQLQLTFNDTVLLWQAELGLFDSGVDRLSWQIEDTFNASHVLAIEDVGARWTAIDTLISLGEEVPVTTKARIGVGVAGASFSLLWVDVKVYTPPTGNVSLADPSDSANGPADEPEPENFGEQLSAWSTDEPEIFWLIIAAIAICLCGTISAIICCICKVCCGDDDDEIYSMRDMSYNNDDWL